jgi:hypothetical protein
MESSRLRIPDEAQHVERQPFSRPGDEPVCESLERGLLHAIVRHAILDDELSDARKGALKHAGVTSKSLEGGTPHV